MCGNNAFSSQCCGCIFILFYTHLKLTLLLHKTVIVNFLLSTSMLIKTVHQGRWGDKSSKILSTQFMNTPSVVKTRLKRIQSKSRDRVSVFLLLEFNMHLLQLSNFGSKPNYLLQGTVLILSKDACLLRLPLLGAYLGSEP